jgi:Deoxyribonuclease NucA/NucB
VLFDDDRWPNIADHIRDAQRLRKRGRLRFPRIFHIDRAGAKANRRESLRGIPTKRGFDRDEYPPAVAREGGKGAHIRYVRSGENRSAGSYMGNELQPYCSKQRFRLLAVR